MIYRDIKNHILNEAKFYPVIAVIGARQVGKTTLIQDCFPEKQVINFEELKNRKYLNADPDAFLKQFSSGAFFDEVQHVPELFSYLQILADQNQVPGQFIISGSQNLLISEKISQSLAGRVSIIEMHAFSFNELDNANLLPETKSNALFKGFYPPIYDRKIPPVSWYENYVISYLQKDIKKLMNIKNVSNFKRFLSLCAANSGQLLNIERIATAVKISRETAYSWLNILEQTYIIFFLRPYFKNYSKRVIKSPKLFFHDTGLLCSLLNITEENYLTDIYNFKQIGGLFENLIISEIKKEIDNYKKRVNMYFWRDSKKNEVDLILEKNGKVMPIEIKSSTTPKVDFLNNILKWQQICNDRQLSAKIIYGGSQTLTIKEIDFIPWNNIHKKILNSF